VTTARAVRTGCYKRRMERQPQEGMTRAEVTRLVNRYIGVEGGYLGDFSYRLPP
jgi:hypothetical protein